MESLARPHREGSTTTPARPPAYLQTGGASATPYVGQHQGAELLHWMVVQNYVSFAATTIRRMIEPPRKTANPNWRSVSIVILLEDMAANDTVITRQRFCSLYKKSVALPFADRDFNNIARKKQATHLSATRIRRDLKEIERACEWSDGWSIKLLHTLRKIGEESGRSGTGRLTEQSTCSKRLSSVTRSW